MAAEFLNQNYDEGEESDNDFNPGAVVASDDEGEPENNKNVDLSIADRAPSPSKIQTQTPKEIAQKSRSRSPVGLLESGARLDDGEEAPDNGEDDEGEGEDLGDDDEDDEDDEEEEDEEDEDAIVGRPRKRRRRGGNQFIEEEAEVDDEDDEENEADEDDIAETGFIQDTHPDDDLGPEADQDDRRHRELDRQRQIEASQDAEATAQRLKEQYGRRTTQSMNKSAFVPQNLLMPSVDDPSIWDVKCKPGKERDVVMAVSRKVMSRMSAGRPLKICSVFERGGGSMAGRVFVEARRKVDVDEAMEGIPDCYPRTKVDLVPVKEMPDLLRIQKSEVINLGEYVRLKRGLYQGDLGVVEDVLDNGVDVLVRLVPRLNYGLDEDDGRPSNGVEKRKRTPFAPTYSITNRPPQRLFNEAEAKKRHGKHLIANRGLASRSWTYKNDTYEDGFLLKSFKANVLETKNVKPVLEEVIKLKKTAADGSEAIDLERLAHTLKNDTADSNYVPGDEVEVFQGEQRGLVGRVETVDRSILRIKVTDGELAGQVVDQPVKGVRKRFMQGDHVKVIGAGRYAGEVGMVDQIQDDKVSIITDTSQMTITVFSKDLRAAGEAGGTATSINNLDVQDLVQIDATTVGVVIKSDMEAVRVLDQNGSVVLRLPSQLQKIEPGRHVAVATDKAGTEIRVGDGVKEAIGENKTGTILHIHRGFVFVHDRTRVENSGLWVARCTGIITTMSKGREQQTKVDLSGLAPHLRQQNGAAAAGMAPPQRPGRDRIIGQHVHIRKGMYKGHKGLVKDATATTARVELQSKNKTINVPKQDLSVVEYVFRLRGLNTIANMNAAETQERRRLMQTSQTPEHPSLYEADQALQHQEYRMEASLVGVRRYSLATAPAVELPHGVARHGRRHGQVQVEGIRARLLLGNLAMVRPRRMVVRAT